MFPLKMMVVAIASSMLYWPDPAAALPPQDEIPEEVLRTEIILEARSPLTGAPLSAAEYAELQEALMQNEASLVASEIRELIFLLQLRRVLRPVIPFL
jgi:hypothetical protein